MLRNASSLIGYALHATDGDIGHVDQFFFDDQGWGIRYLVVQTGVWFDERKVVLSNYSIGEVDEAKRLLAVNLTREQIENAPDVDLHRPVSRQWEAAYAAYNGWAPYWEGTGFYDPLAYPGFMVTPIIPLPPAQGSNSPSAADQIPGANASGTAQAATSATPAGAGAPVNPAGMPEVTEEDSHLQSTQDVHGYHIKATDGEIGHVADFILDDRNWSIRYIEVDTRNWWPGKKVLIAPAWIRDIDWSQGQVSVNLPRRLIQDAPEYDPSRPISHQYEIDLLDYYGKYFESIHPELSR